MRRRGEKRKPGSLLLKFNTAGRLIDHLLWLRCPGRSALNWSNDEWTKHLKTLGALWLKWQSLGWMGPKWGNGRFLVVLLFHPLVFIVKTRGRMCGWIKRHLYFRERRRNERLFPGQAETELSPLFSPSSSSLRTDINGNINPHTRTSQVKCLKSWSGADTAGAFSPEHRN